MPAPTDRWAWATNEWGYDTSTQTIFLGGEATSRPNSFRYTKAAALRPYEWTRAGVFFQRLPPDANGYQPFDWPWPADRLEPAAGTLKPVAGAQQCGFSDMSVDGSVACFPFEREHTLRLISPRGVVNDLSLATPRFTFVGAAFFSADGSLVTVSGATGVGNGYPAFGGTDHPKPEEFSVDLVRMSDGSIARFGPPGVRPAMGWQSWLPDGKLVLWRPEGAAGGAPGLYVLDPHGNGQGPEIPIVGTPVGYLSG